MRECRFEIAIIMHTVLVNVGKDFIAISKMQILSTDSIRC